MKVTNAYPGIVIKGITYTDASRMLRTMPDCVRTFVTGGIFEDEDRNPVIWDGFREARLIGKKRFMLLGGYVVRLVPGYECFDLMLQGEE